MTLTVREYFYSSLLPGYPRTLFRLDTGLLLHSFPHPRSRFAFVFILNPTSNTLCRLTFPSTALRSLRICPPSLRTHTPSGTLQDFKASSFIHFPLPGPVASPPSPRQFYTPGSPQYSPSFIACTSTRACLCGSRTLTHRAPPPRAAGPKVAYRYVSSSEHALWLAIATSHSVFLCPFFT